MFESLTQYLDKLEEEGCYGWWRSDRTNDEGEIYRLEMPYVEYCPVVEELIEAVYAFAKEHPEYEMRRYSVVLGRRHLKWSRQGLKAVDVSRADDKTVLCLLMGLIRGEIFYRGAIMEYLDEGVVMTWLKRLRAIDEWRAKRRKNNS